MIEYLFRHLPFITLPLALALLTGVLVHAVGRRWRPVATRRTKLLSLGAMLAAMVLLQQLYSSSDVSADDEFLRIAAASRASKFAARTLLPQDHAVVATYHNDNARTGQNVLERVLTPDNVSPAHFGKLYSFPVDGYIYAQPLYVPQVAVAGSGLHNVVIIATQHDSVYAFDADSPAAEPLWKVNFLNPDAGISTLSAADVNASDIVPEVGITSTPVIDLATNTIYVVAATKENGAFYHRLHALDLGSGAEKFGGPRAIEGTYRGMAQDGTDGMLTFSSRFQLQRAALLLSKGRIYVAFGSYADYGLYHGWLMAYDATTLRQRGAWVSTPDTYQGGIWMSGCGPSADEEGNLYLSTANGPFDAVGDEPGSSFSDSVIKLTPRAHEIKLLDYFTPYNQQALAEGDIDLGSAGVLLLPDQPGPFPHLAVTSAKNGAIYLLNRDRLGGYSARSGDPQVRQEMAGQLQQQMGTPAYWSGRLYFGAGAGTSNESIKAFSVRNGLLSSSPVSQSAADFHLSRMTVSVSADGAGNGIVWAVDNDAYYKVPQGAAVLHAYDANNLARELYSSNQRFGRDNPGQSSKFTVPTIADGKVFVGAANQLSVYGLLPAAGK